MIKYLKPAALILLSFVLAQAGLHVGLWTKGQVESYLFNQIGQNGTAHDTVFRIYNLLNAIHFRELIIGLVIILATFAGSLFIRKYYPRKWIRIFILLSLLWLVVVYLIPVIILAPPTLY